jgi:hypothetical protein
MRSTMAGESNRPARTRRGAENRHYPIFAGRAVLSRPPSNGARGVHPSSHDRRRAIGGKITLSFPLFFQTDPK